MRQNRSRRSPPAARAADPEGAADRGFRRTAFERRNDGRHLFGVDRDRTAAVPAAASRGDKTGANPLLG